MGIYRKIAGQIFSILILLLISGNALGAEALLPENIVLQKAFKPGIGASVGNIQLVQGTVVILHSGQKEGYQAQKNLPIFKKDTIITLKKGRVRLALDDGSIITLASETKIEINDSVYAPRKKSRFSFLSMAWGKARFWVKKMVDLKRSEFTVRSQTAVVGVRGSDFIVRATPNITHVIALDKTRLALFSRAKPELKPVLVNDFERVIIRLGEKPSEIERLSPMEINQIRQEFAFFPRIDRPGPRPPMPKRGILVPEEELKEPDSTIDSPPPTPDMNIIEREEIHRLEEGILEHQQDFSEDLLDQKLEDTLLQSQELPPLPGTPE